MGTTHGVFQLRRPRSNGTEHTHLVEENTVLAEVCLFTHVVHRATLMALTYAETLKLTRVALAEAVKQSPSCVSMVYTYAQNVLCSLTTEVTETEDGALAVDDIMDEEYLKKACAPLRPSEAK